MSDEEESHQRNEFWGYFWYGLVMLCIVGSASLGMFATTLSRFGIFVSAVICMVVWTAVILPWHPTWMGFLPYCERDLPNPCKNGGKCISDGHWDYDCNCLDGWDGPTCSSINREDIENRPCRKDGINPCFHNAKCTDVDTDHDGLYDDFTCECPDIRGTDGQYKWEGKTCNDFPEDLDSSLYNEEDCSIAVDGKSERENRMLRYCQDNDRCYRWDKLPMKCKTDCDNAGTTIWCDATDRCIDNADPIAIEACDSLVDIPYPGEDRNDGRLSESERKQCELDSSTHIVGDECVCVDDLEEECGKYEDDSSQCNLLECCKYKNGECVADGKDGDLVFKINKRNRRGGRRSRRSRRSRLGSRLRRRL